MAAHRVDVEETTFFVATCMCGWRSHQEWDTRIGAERDGDFHIDHPVLTGETPAIEIEEKQ